MLLLFCLLWFAGVYGTHAYEKSEFVLSVYRPYRGSVIASSSYTEAEGEEYSSGKGSSYTRPRSKATQHDEESSQSMLWTILEFFFKIIIEILL